MAVLKRCGNDDDGVSSYQSGLELRTAVLNNLSTRDYSYLAIARVGAPRTRDMQWSNWK
jgi:hypothetical protein